VKRSRDTEVTCVTNETNSVAPVFVLGNMYFHPHTFLGILHANTEFNLLLYT
jgi:hypothetical protein